MFRVLSPELFLNSGGRVVEDGVLSDGGIRVWACGARLFGVGVCGAVLCLGLGALW